MVRAPSKSFRFDSETLELVDAIGRKLGLTQTAVLKVAVRRLAAVERIKRPEPRPGADCYSRDEGGDG